MNRTLTALAAAAALAAVPAAASALPVLQHVEAQRGTSADRLVFTFRGGLPTTARQFAIGRVTQDGSGAPVAVRGRAFRILVFAMADAHERNGRASCAPRTVTPTLDVLVQARLSGDFEGQVSYGVGLTRQVTPRIQRRPAARQIVVLFPR